MALNCLFLAVLSISVYGVFATVELSCSSNEDTRYCINDLVQYQCNIPGDDFVTLVWRVLNGSSPLGQGSHTTDDTINDPLTLYPGFTTELTSNGNPLTAILSYTVSESYDGFTIECRQGGNTETCNITIQDFGVISIAEPSCTSTSVQVSWTNTDTDCVANYTITGLGAITITTSDTSYDIPVSSLVAGTYNVYVHATDTGGRMGPQAVSPASISITVPSTVNFTYTLYEGEGDTAIVELSWAVTVLCPSISSYYITIGDTTVSVPGDITTYRTTDGVSNGTSVTVFAGNAIGNGTMEFETIDIPEEPLPSLTPTSFMATPTPTPTNTTNTTDPTNTGPNIGAIVGPLGTVVVVVVMIIIISFVVTVFHKGKHSRKPVPASDELNYADLEMSDKKSSSKKPSTKKTEAPPADSVLYSDVSHGQTQPNTGQQMVYADLDLATNNNGPRNGSRGVEYSDLKRY